MINFKGGKIEWNLFDHKGNGVWSEDTSSEDMLLVSYDNGNLIIDVGYYYGSEYYCIAVVSYYNVKEADREWRPCVDIPCKDFQDMLVQLQRAIDIYPRMYKQQAIKLILK